MISAVIVSLNEEKKIEKCLESLNGFAQEIIIVDLGSTDGSHDVYKRFNAKVFNHEEVEYVELVRDFAISKASGEWVLVLDPDEQISEELKENLKKITEQNDFIAVNICRKNIFFGRWIAHTNWWPDRHIRFFKKGKVKWSNEIHSYPKVDGKILYFPEKEDLAIIHFGYDNFGQFLDRQNRYSSIEAKQRIEKGERFAWINFLWWPLREFLVRYIKHLGFLDGFYGFSLTYFMMVYKIIVLVKMWELKP